MPEPAHGAIVLAAGASTRLGQPKQLLMHHGETLVHRATRLALATRPRDAVIVLGAQADSIFPQVENLPIRRVDCADWALGMGASLRAGIAALSPECEGVLVVLCDQPQLEVEHLLALRTAWEKNPQRGAVSVYANRFGVPALLPRPWFDALRADDDRGARAVLEARANEIVGIRNELLAIDIDRVEDLGILE